MSEIKVGVCQWAFPLEGPASCALVAELGLMGMQLEMGTAERGYPLSKKSIQQAWLTAARQAGISFPSIALRDSGLAAPRGHSRWYNYRHALPLAVTTAVELGAAVIMLPSYDGDTVTGEEEFSNTIENLQFACDLAARENLIIASENPFPPEQLHRLFRLISDKNFALYHDSQNHYRNTGIRDLEILKEFSDRVVEMHVKDGIKNELSSMLLGSGECQVQQQIQLLQRHDYNGWLHLENYYDYQPLSRLAKDPLDLVRQDSERLRSMLKSGH